MPSGSGRSGPKTGSPSGLTLVLPSRPFLRRSSLTTPGTWLGLGLGLGSGLGLGPGLGLGRGRGLGVGLGAGLGVGVVLVQGRRGLVGHGVGQAERA